MISILHVNHPTPPTSNCRSQRILVMLLVSSAWAWCVIILRLRWMTWECSVPSDQVKKPAPAPKRRNVDIPVRLFRMGIVHEHHYQVSMEFRWIYGNVDSDQDCACHATHCRLLGWCCHSDSSAQIDCTSTDSSVSIMPPVMRRRNEPPELKQRSIQQTIRYVLALSRWNILDRSLVVPLLEHYRKKLVAAFHLSMSEGANNVPMRAAYLAVVCCRREIIIIFLKKDNAFCCGYL